MPNDWPRRPYFIDTTPLAAFAIRIGMPSGETLSGPRSSMIVCCSSIVVMPADPGADDAGGAVRVAGRAPRARPASSSASPAAVSASWVKRSERRTSFTDRCSLGSNSSQRPSPSSMPERPALQRSWSVRAPTPSGVTAPTPVITTLAPHDSF